jgi:hypothetical protein
MTVGRITPAEDLWSEFASAAWIADVLASMVEARLVLWSLCWF